MAFAGIQGGLRDENEEEDIHERRHFHRIVNAFNYYRVHSLKRLLIAEKSYKDLPDHHKELLSGFSEHLANIRTCIEHNYQIVLLVIENTDHMFENKNHGPLSLPLSSLASDYDMDKVKTTLRQFVRDWSEEGQVERDTCYKPVILEILRRFPPEECNLEEISILVPGSGLGRLAFEIARHGYTCQGNEFSLFMLFASNFILNRCQMVNGFTLYPWVHQYCNNIRNSDQLRSIQFPDVNPADIPKNSNFSMAAGDFLEIYTEPECWDCVATVYFIDTAHNIIAYIETIWHILKPGGYWINFGPLLYHFADLPSESSVELSYEDVKNVIKKFNFIILHEEMAVPSSYTQNPKSMLKYQYDCVFFVAQKPQVTATAASPSGATANHTR